jgi:hypothetical protein
MSDRLRNTGNLVSLVGMPVLATVPIERFLGTLTDGTHITPAQAFVCGGLAIACSLPLISGYITNP